MTAVGHVATTGLVKGNPGLRLAWGFLSHWLLDITVAEYPYPPSAKHWKWYTYQVMGVILFCYLTGDWLAIAYGMVWDLIDGLYQLVKRRPLWWFHYHRNMIFKQQRTCWQTIGVEAALLIAFILFQGR